jgi:hypothetical protein
MDDRVAASNLAQEIPGSLNPVVAIFDGLASLVAVRNVKRQLLNRRVTSSAQDLSQVQPKFILHTSMTRLWGPKSRPAQIDATNQTLIRFDK